MGAPVYKTSIRTYISMREAQVISQ